MGKETKIQWSDATVNFWTGCTKVSDGCRFCYMYRDKERFNLDPTEVVRTKPKTFNQALNWKEGKNIFTCSWSDFFIKEADDWRGDAWDIIRATPQHTWQILTKRPERIMDCLPSYFHELRNVFIGVSIESDKFAEERLYFLNEVKQLFRNVKTFASVEPLIGYVDFIDDSVIKDFYFSQLDWVIVGGESGNEVGRYRYRHCELDWIRKVVEQSKRRGIKVFVKQLGTSLSKELGLKDRHGGDIEEWPLDIQVREMP